MNTDAATEAYPLHIEVVDYFDTPTNPVFTSKTFFIKIKPNTAPIFRDQSSEGNIIENGILGIGLHAASSGDGEIRKIFATNILENPLEADNIKLTTGSVVPSGFDDDFTITFNNSLPTNPNISTSTPSIIINQYASQLNPDEEIVYQFVVTASDEHHQAGEDEDSVSYLTVNLNISNNQHPQLSSATHSFSINENTVDNHIVGELDAFDPDASTSGIEEQPYIAGAPVNGLELIGAFYKHGGFPLFEDINTGNYTNITNSLGGTSLLDPTANPFMPNAVGSTLAIKRKSGVFLNHSIANLYEYRVNIGGNFTASGADIGIVQIKLLNHEADTPSVNWGVENPYIIESAVSGDELKINSNGRTGDSATISFNRSHIYTVTSSNDFIQTPPQGLEAVLKLSKDISGSYWTSENSSQSLNNSINLKVTASEALFPTTQIFRDYTINISPNFAPDLTVVKQPYYNNQTVVGTVAGANVLAHISYGPDAENDAPNFDSFIFEGDSLEAVIDQLNNRYEIFSTVPNGLNVGNYPFKASLKDIHGFVSSSIEDFITVRDVDSPDFISHADDFNPADNTPLFYILETATEGEKVVNESHGRPGDGTPSFLSINYNTSQESNNSTTDFTLYVGADSNIFSIIDHIGGGGPTSGRISAGTGFANYINSNGIIIGDIISVTVEYISNAGFIRYENISIKIADNTPPVANVEASTITLTGTSVGVNTNLLIITPTNTSIQTLEGDTIIQPSEVYISGPDQIQISNTIYNDDGVYIVKNDENITPDAPEGGNYNADFTSNGNFIFYVVEGASEGDNVVIQSNGVSSGTPAEIGVNYTSDFAQNYNYNFNLEDDKGQFTNYNGNILISPPTAQFSNFSISVDGNTNKFNIDSNGQITVGSDFNYEYNEANDSDVITATITATDSYGNSTEQPITINITENHAPILNTNPDGTFVESITFPNLVSPVPGGTIIISFETSPTSIFDAQGDEVTLTHQNAIGGASVDIIGGLGNNNNKIQSPYTDSKLKIVLRQGHDLINPTPADSLQEYTPTIEANYDVNLRFYIVETAGQGSPVQTALGGIGGNPATITANYTTPSDDEYAYNISLRDDTGLQTDYNSGNSTPGFIKVAHTQSSAVEYSITTNPPNKFQILTVPGANGNQEGIIQAGQLFPALNLEAGNTIEATVTVLNSYGHSHDLDILVEVAGNQPPTFNVTAHTLQLPITSDDPLLTIFNISDPEDDNVNTPTVDGSNPSIVITKAIGGDTIALNSPAGNTTNGYDVTKLVPSTTVAGDYDWTVTMTDEHGNSRTITSADPGQTQITINQQAPTVRLYKVNMDNQDDEVFDNTFMGFSNGQLGLPAGTIEGSVLDHFENEPFTTSEVTVGVGFQTGRTLKFIAQLDLETISDVAQDQDNHGNNNGLSQFGTVTLNGEKLVIVFPANIADTPNVMLDFIPTTNNPDTYYIYSIGDFIGGASALASNIISFTKDGTDFKMINLENQLTGDYKFYLFPDEYNTNLPTS